jgi:hypothetical protein
MSPLSKAGLIRRIRDLGLEVPPGAPTQLRAILEAMGKWIGWEHLPKITIFHGKNQGKIWDTY